MAVTELLARDWTFELNNGSSQSPDWVEIGGINTWSHSPTANDADTTTFDDDGRLSHMKASRGDEFTLSALYQEDPDTGDRDPGQEACETWATLVGHASKKQFRITSPGGTVLTFEATATVTSGGGGNDDPAAWECTVTVTGAITSSSAPAIPGTPTSVSGTTDDSFSIITWTDSATGAPFDKYEVAAFVDGVEVKRITVTTEEVAYFAPLTNGTGYTFKVRAHNAAGWGDWSAASSTVTPAS